MSDGTPALEALKTRMKATWGAGDFGVVAKSVEKHAEEFVARRHITPGMRVLDVACGTGNVTIPAAKAGAKTTGVDIAPSLLEQARARAKREELNVRLEEGDAEDLPCPEASFDLVVSMYGAMFAPRPQRTAGELVRVCRPGGRIAMANWTPDGFIGQMLKVTASHSPPPDGVPSPLLWGDEAVVRERLGDAVTDLRFKKVTVPFQYPFSPAETVEFFRTYYGPMQRVFEALPGDEQSADLRSDLEDLWQRHNRASDGTTYVEADYLEVVATRA